MLFFKPLRASILLCLITAPLAALTVDSNVIQNRALYGILFPGEARAYYGKEASLVSVSMQEYRTAAFSVVEINLTTEGSALLRIYHSRPLKPGELQEDAANAAGAAGVPGSSIIQRPLPPGMKTLAERGNQTTEALTSSTVVKEYPFATHAHTIEYRLRSRDELYDLFDELKKHWLKEPAFFENGQIVDQAGATDQEMKPRSLGGTIFQVEN